MKRTIEDLIFQIFIDLLFRASVWLADWIALQLWL